MSQETSRLSLMTAEDIPAVVNLIKDLFNHSVYSTVTTFDEEYVSRTLGNVLQADLSRAGVLVLWNKETPVGCLSMARTGFMGKPEMAVETTFWIKPEYRSRQNIKLLIGAYLYWAKKYGCKAALIGKLKDKNSPEYYKVVRI